MTTRSPLLDPLDPPAATLPSVSSAHYRREPRSRRLLIIAGLLSAGLHLANNLRRKGYRVLVHDFAANSENNPSLREFEFVSDLNALAKRDDVDLAVICCPWPQYGSLKISSAIKVVSTWQL